MAIGGSKLNKILRKGRVLSDALAWFDFFTTENRLFILDLIRQKQLFEQGINKDGEIIGVYSYWTEWISKGKKQQGDPYTLKDTGDFYQSMFITVLSDAFEINADAQKGNDNLFEKYGTEIIGITEENLNLIIQELRKNYQNYVRKVLFGA